MWYGSVFVHVDDDDDQHQITVLTAHLERVETLDQDESDVAVHASGTRGDHAGQILDSARVGADTSLDEGYVRVAPADGRHAQREEGLLHSRVGRMHGLGHEEEALATALAVGPRRRGPSVRQVLLPEEASVLLHVGCAGEVVLERLHCGGSACVPR